MNFPEPFVSNIHHSFGEAGEFFLKDLPDLITDASMRWGLTEIETVPMLSYNYVAFAMQGKREVVLKLGVPNRELTSEMYTLKLFNGEGACRVLDLDEDKGLLLIERLRPGTMLVNIQDDDERTHIALDVMLQICRPVPISDTFIKLIDWFGELKHVRVMFEGGTGPFPKELFERVEASLPELFATDDMCLLHGDFHHFNILHSERGWLVIDPKGVIGPAGYEIGPLMLNPWDESMGRDQFEVHTKRRVNIIHERTGWAREKILGWALAHSILSAWWDYPSQGWENSLARAEVFAALK